MRSFLRTIGCASAVAALAAACSPDSDDIFGRPAAGDPSTAASGVGGAGSTSSTSAGGGGAGGSTVDSGSGGGPATTTGAGGGGGCEVAIWYCDDDLDGHGDAEFAVESCTPPEPQNGCDAFVVVGDDCAPEDPAGFPGQTEYFAEPLAGPLHGVEPFDYDCSHALERNPEQLFEESGQVQCFAEDCILGTSGFSNNAPCGEKSGHFRCDGGLDGCNAEEFPTNAPLRCH